MESKTTVLYRVHDVIRTVRNQRVIIDSDLAKLYGVPTKRLNEAVKRNSARFPHDFMFQLKQSEVTALQAKPINADDAELVCSRSQIATLNVQPLKDEGLTEDALVLGMVSKRGQNIKHLPYAFTEPERKRIGFNVNEKQEGYRVRPSKKPRTKKTQTQG